ncbi:hypothetical protein [Paracoccus contaminans]|nr:hypothetical protein [Paracoccus contaminans]
MSVYWKNLSGPPPGSLRRRPEPSDFFSDSLRVPARAEDTIDNSHDPSPPSPAVLISILLTQPRSRSTGLPTACIVTGLITRRWISTGAWRTS